MPTGGKQPSRGQALAGRNILLVVTGGIAAYKAAFLTRILARRGAAVRALMTGAAREFVTPLTFETLTGNPVPLDLFSPRDDEGVRHVKLAAWADAVLVAPATADFIARTACGIADDLPSSVVCAARCPVVLAPAMNDGMWDNPATKRNIGILEEDGRLIVPPGEGDLACGTSGRGRMAEPEEIASFLEGMLSPRVLEGVRVLVTAGRTEEHIDAVRYISNRSSGRMGFALARRAAAMGASVELVHGPVDVPVPGVDRAEAVTSAAEMARAVREAFARCDLLLMTAAVADFTPAKRGAGKIKRGEKGISLELVPTDDILASLAGKRKDGQVTVGFALESEEGEEGARRKIADKGCDYLVLNMIGEDTGFDTATNRITVFKGSGKVLETPLMSKEEVAGELLGLLAADSRIGRAKK